MKKILIVALLFLFSLTSHSQTAKDLFNSSNVKVVWLGVDYSHVKLIGEFSQFNDAGHNSSQQIRDIYFSRWNHLILNEPSKYDIKGMLRLNEITNDIDMVTELNSATPLEEMESNSNPNYSTKDIEEFIASYKTEYPNAIGIVLIAESLNKNAIEAYYHFVALNMNTKEILIHKRLRGEPAGFGLRNYWAGSIYHVIKSINKYHYRVWKKQVLKKD